MAPGHSKPCRRSCLVARPPAARSSTTYQITQVKGKNSPLSHAKRQRWPRRRAPEAVSDAIASQVAVGRPYTKMPKVSTPIRYRRRAAPPGAFSGQGYAAGEVDIQAEHRPHPAHAYDADPACRRELVRATLFRGLSRVKG